MMFSLYTLSSLAFLVIFAFLVLLYCHVLIFLNQSDLTLWGKVFVDSTKVVSLALLLSLPFSTALTFVTVTWASPRFSPMLSQLNSFIGKAPYLLYGLAIVSVFHFSATLVSLFTLSALSVAQLSHRWIKTSKEVRRQDLECMLSLGAPYFQSIYQLYIKRFFFNYLGHFLSVYFSLYFVVTPLLCLRLTNEDARLISYEIFQKLQIHPEQTSLMVLTLMIFHGVRFGLDRHFSYLEADFG